MLLETKQKKEGTKSGGWCRNGPGSQEKLLILLELQKTFQAVPKALLQKELDFLDFFL